MLRLTSVIPDLDPVSRPVTVDVPLEDVAVLVAIVVEPPGEAG